MPVVHLRFQSKSRSLFLFPQHEAAELRHVQLSLLSWRRNGSFAGFWRRRPEKILPRGINRRRNGPKFAMPGCFRSENIPATGIYTSRASIRSWFGQLIESVYRSQFGKPWVWRTCRPGESISALKNNIRYIFRLTIIQFLTDIKLADFDCPRL
jgi:hypothetical protein